MYKKSYKENYTKMQTQKIMNIIKSERAGKSEKEKLKVLAITGSTKKPFQ